MLAIVFKYNRLRQITAALPQLFRGAYLFGIVFLGAKRYGRSYSTNQHYAHGNTGTMDKDGALGEKTLPVRHLRDRICGCCDELRF